MGRTSDQLGQPGPGEVPHPDRNSARPGQGSASDSPRTTPTPNSAVPASTPTTSCAGPASRQCFAFRDPDGTLSPSPRPHDRRQLSRGRDANVSTAARIRRRARRPAEGSASSWISWLTHIAIPLSTVARSRAATFDRSGRSARTSAARKDSQRVTVAIASSNAVPDRAHVGRPAGPPAGGRWQGSAVCAHLAANARHDYCARGSGAARMARSKRATVRGNGSR